MVAFEVAFSHYAKACGTGYPSKDDLPFRAIPEPRLRRLSLAYESGQNKAYWVIDRYPLPPFRARFVTLLLAKNWVGEVCESLGVARCSNHSRTLSFKGETEANCHARSGF